MDCCNLFSLQGGIFSFSMLLLDCFQGVCVGIIQVYVDIDVVVQVMLLMVLLVCDVCVDVFDGEWLLQIFYLQVGINQIDICNFLFGNYLVCMCIYEDGVLVCIEEVLFDKGGDWINSQWQWFVQGGCCNECCSDCFDGECVVMVGLCVLFGCDVVFIVGVVNFGGYSYGELCLDLCYVLVMYEMCVMFSGMWGSDGSNGQQYQLLYWCKVLWNFYQQCMCGKVCQFEVDVCDQLGCINLFSGLMLLLVVGGNVYVGYMWCQIWCIGWYCFGFEQDLLFGLDLLLLFGLLELCCELVLSCIWQVSFSCSYCWQDFSVFMCVGLWQQCSIDSVCGSNECDCGIYFNFSLICLQCSYDSSGQCCYVVDVCQLQYQCLVIDYSVGQSLCQDWDMYYWELNVELCGNNIDCYSVLLSGQLQNGIGNIIVSIVYYQQCGCGEIGYSVVYSFGFVLGCRGFYWSGVNGVEVGLVVQVDGFDDVDLYGVVVELQVGGLC